MAKEKDENSNEEKKSANKIVNLNNVPLDKSDGVQEKVIQNPDLKSAEYLPQSQICSTVDTVAPVQLLYEMNKSIGLINRKVRGIDEYVRAKLGYNNLIELCEALSAEQVDAIGVAIYQIEEKNQAVIVGDMTGVGKGRIAGAIMRYARLQGKVPIFFTEKPNLFSDIYRDIIAIGSDRGIVQDYLTGEREKEVKTTVKEIREKIEEDIDNGDYDLSYDEDRLFKKGYETETINAIEEYRELFFPTTIRTVPTYKRNVEYEKTFKRVDKKFVPFIVNNRSTKTNIQDTNGNYIYKSLDNESKKKIYEDGVLPDEFDCIVLTYSQIRNPNKGKEKSEFIKQMAHGNIIIMDESHNASGSSNTGQYLQEILGVSKGATFLSATFAKRPDNMPIYAMKTAISDAGLSNRDLIEAIMQGGVALQEILSADLVSEGQMVRREKSYEGIDVNYVYLDDSLEQPDSPFYNPKFNLKQEHRDISDKVTSIIRNIIDFQYRYVNPIIEKMDTQFAEEQERIKQVKPLQEAGINNPPLFNGIFNLINQLILSTKADAIAEWAIMRMKQGKKPVIALANTMESFLEYMIESNPDGGNSHSIKTDFSIVLKRRLLSTLKYTRRYADGTNEVEYLDPNQQSAPFVDAYTTILEDISSASMGINVSPIDVILTKIRKSGFSIEEVTGRNKYVEFTSDKTGIIKNRIRPNSADLFRKFNTNEIDALLINQSGATGASAHAIKNSKAKVIRYDNEGKAVIPTSLENTSEVKQRVMIVLQAELNVNTEVQKRGRINRTGQVFLPIYDYLISAIPAEMRLMMMLQKKLKSLDANTTSNQKQTTQVIDVVDFLNEYGDDVVIDYMKNNPAVNQMTGNILKFDGDQPTDATKKVEDRAHRVSGRIAILSSEMQEEFYTSMISDYNAFVQKKIDAGEDNLQVVHIPLRAKKVETTVVEPPNTEGRRSVFSEGVYLEKSLCENLRKPYSEIEVGRMIDSALSISEGIGKSIKLTPEEMLKYHLDKFYKHVQEKYESDKSDAELMKSRDMKAIEDSKAYLRLENEGDKLAFRSEKQMQIEQEYNERMERLDKANQNIKAKIESDLKFFYVKRKIDYPLAKFEEEGNRVDGICLGATINYNAKNPFAPSAIEIRIVLANSLKMVRFKLTDTFLSNIKEATRVHSNLDMQRSLRASDYLLEIWDEKTKEGRADKIFKYIVTGNILKALGDAEFRTSSKLIRFTTDDDKIRTGVLLPDTFKPQQYDVTLPISKALPIIMNLSSGAQMYVKGTGISIGKAGNYWKLTAGKKNSHSIYKDLEITKYAVIDRWEERSNLWTLQFEKPQVADMISYLDDTYKFKVTVPYNIFEAWKDKLGYTEAIEQDMEKSNVNGEQEIIKKVNEEYENYEQQRANEEKPKAEDEIELAEGERMEDVVRDRDIQTMKLKMVTLYFKIKNHLKAKEAEKMQRGGNVSELNAIEAKKLRYLLGKYKTGNATPTELKQLAEFIDHVKTKIVFSEARTTQIDYYIKKNELNNMKPHDYATFADLMLTEFGDALFG